jgi:hypothetical protein
VAYRVQRIATNNTSDTLELLKDVLGTVTNYKISTRTSKITVP